MSILLFFLLILIPSSFSCSVQLLSNSPPSLSSLSGLTGRLGCSLLRCSPPPDPDQLPLLSWLKDGALLFNGTEFELASGLDPARVVLQRTPQRVDGGISGNYTGQDYILLLRNLTVADSGQYSCRLAEDQDQLDFRLEVIADRGLKLDSNEQWTYDHAECCIERGVSPLCRPVCRPRDIQFELFDPTSCHANDLANFLHCATDGGKREYRECCSQRAVPTQCAHFCSHKVQSSYKANSLCLHHLPAIFDCFNQEYVTQRPEAPKDVHVEMDGKGGRKLCWKVKDKGQEMGSSKRMSSGTFWVYLKEMAGGGGGGGERDDGLRRSAGRDEDDEEEKRRGRGGRKRKRRKRREGEEEERWKVVVETEIGIQQNVKRHRAGAEDIDWGSNSLLCLFLHDKWIRPDRRYIAFVSASLGNDDQQGPNNNLSEPSQPILIEMAT